MWPYRTDSTIHFWCHVCGEMGDIVKFIGFMEGISFLEACEHLGVLLDDQPVTAHKRAYNPHDDDPPVEEWQRHAKAFAETCKANLWATPAILAWLRARGLTDEMIDRAGLGYNPTDRFIERKDWGIERQDDPKKIWLPRGITIPWLIEGQLWAMKIRRSKSDMERDHKRGIKKPSKYVLVSGSSNGIYGIDRIVADPSKPTLIVEGEFDKLIGEQCVGDFCNVVATGGTSNGHGERWALTLSMSPVVLVGFDADPSGNGKKAAKDYWLKAIPHSTLWLPWGAKDVNDMHLLGKSLRAWVEVGIELATFLNDDKPNRHMDVPEALEAIRELPQEERAARLAEIIPCATVEILPTQDAYNMPEWDPLPAWPPKGEDFWTQLERRLGPGFKMTPTPRSAYWHLVGYEDQPIPSVYRGHIS